MPVDPAPAPDVSTGPEFMTFYRTHLPTVYGYLLRLAGGDRGLAEDLTQDTWFALVQSLRRGRHECADIRWLLSVARSRYIDHVRRVERGRRKLQLIAGDRSAIVDADEPPSSAQVLADVEGLEPHQRLVLMMRYVDGLGVPHIAETIGRSVSATNSLLARARHELREIRRTR